MYDDTLAESVFDIGSTHEVCEDYAIGKEDWTILSDGCSNGNGPRIHTDWGSRFLCAAGLEHLLGTGIGDMEQYMTAVGHTVKTQRNVFPLIPEACLTATLLGQTRLDDVIKSFAIGDGVIGGKRRDGRWKIYVIDFIRGGTQGKAAPFYLKYKFCNEVDQYVKLFGGAYKVTTYFGVLNNPEMEYPAEPPTGNQEWEKFSQQRQEMWAQVMTETEKEYHVTANPYFMAEFPLEEYEFTFQCSDGAETFRWIRANKTGRSKEEIHVLDVLRILFNFRAYTPGFLHRAVHWQLKTNKPGTFQRRGWFHEDDFSVGGIYCGKHIDTAETNNEGDQDEE